ncbi:potassium-transporting ATPase subunit F [Massilia alkalitolerans]|nr:potassium-transporting ATPase subunit F [Massilia alkalitolerans]
MNTFYLVGGMVAAGLLAYLLAALFKAEEL